MLSKGGALLNHGGDCRNAIVTGRSADSAPAARHTPSAGREFAGQPGAFTMEAAAYTK
jgi:hypothetical protein